MADDLEVTIARIEELLKKATPGPWYAEQEYVFHKIDGGMVAEARGFGAGWPVEATAEYIAAVSPSVIQQMIEKLRMLERERDMFRGKRDDLNAEAEKWHAGFQDEQRRAETAEQLNRELAEGLSVIAEALKEPAGGSYWPAREYLDKRDVFHDDLEGMRVLCLVANTALSRVKGKK